MKPFLRLLPLLAATLCAAQPLSLKLVEPAVQTRLAVDTNPLASGGSAAAILPVETSLVAIVGGSFGVAVDRGAAPSPLTLSYAGEAQRFDTRASENFSTHRLALTAATTAGEWKFSADASTLYVAGSRDSLPSVAGCNANAVSLWRERRRQWQHRARVQARTDLGALVLRGTATLLDYDYLTRVVAGNIGFSDRSDLQAALEAGWKQSATSLWLAGFRAGEQHQAVIPLPNCEFDYSNHYERLTAGWEGKLFSTTTVTFAAGPSFHHYDGAIDPRVFAGGRDRTALWGEASFVSKFTPAFTLSGKAARQTWLSSTGKSAYIDTSSELVAALALDAAWSARASAKLHGATYFPAVRDDWELFLGGGLSRKLSPRTTLSLDLLRHRGWNGLARPADREFHRTVISLGCVVKF